jgi:hypothetical protein
LRLFSASGVAGYFAPPPKTPLQLRHPRTSSLETDPL